MRSIEAQQYRCLILYDVLPWSLPRAPTRSRKNPLTKVRVLDPRLREDDAD